MSQCFEGRALADADSKTKLWYNLLQLNATYLINTIPKLVLSLKFVLNFQVDAVMFRYMCAV